MRKLVFLFLILGSIGTVFNCTEKNSAPPVKVVSVADLALTAKLLNGDSKTSDQTESGEVSILSEMHRSILGQLNKSGKSPNYEVTDPCCACGTNCCNSCGDMGGMSFVANEDVKAIFLTSKSNEGVSIQLVSKSVNGLKVFNFRSSIPDGQYVFRIESASPTSSFIIPITVQESHMKLGL